MKLIYIGYHFYHESRTYMSPIYTETGERSDWGFVQIALKNGENVEIRQATKLERDFYEVELLLIKERFDKEKVE
jgi:hypothetical protein